MRVILLLLGAIVVLVWAGLGMRAAQRDVAQILFVLAFLLGVLLVGAFFGLIGE